MINRKTKKVILLEFKRTRDSGEGYFQNMWKVTEKQHTPILTGLRALVTERGWEVEVVPVVVSQWSVREKGWMHPPLPYAENMRSFSEATGGICSGPPVVC